MYVTKEAYQREHDIIPDEEIDKRLKQASRHIDSLTFNRIVGCGFEKLTDYQRDTITEVCCDMADFEYENEDMINCVLEQYAINGVSMSFGNSWNVSVTNGIAIKRELYEQLCSTGLCNRTL